MSSQKPVKREIADFFRPYPRNNLPLKRPSPSGSDDHLNEVPKRPNSPIPRTPASARFKDATRSPFKSPFTPTTNSAVSIPIRSPRPPKSVDRSTYGPGPLFASKLDLRSPPPLSPSPPPTASPLTPDVARTAQSVVKDGEVVEVRGSDEEGSDLDSLLSLDEIMGRKKEQTATSNTPPELDDDDAEAERKSMLNMFLGHRAHPLVGKDRIRAMRVREQEHKFDISTLMNDHFDDAEVAANVSKAQIAYQMDQRTGESGLLDTNLLTSINSPVDGEQTDNSRLLDAVARTGALATERSYSFFGSMDLHERQAQKVREHDMPKTFSSDEVWRDAAARSRALCSGHVGELAAAGRVEDSWLRWIFYDVALQPSDELRRASIATLIHASPVWTRTNVTAADVQRIFAELGASSEAFGDGSKVEASFVSLQPQVRPAAKYLVDVLELFQALAGDMDFAALSKLVSLTGRLAMDSETMADGRIASTVEDTLTALLELDGGEARAHCADRLISDLGSTVAEPFLQVQLLEHLLPTSHFAAWVRTCLAHRFLFGQKSQLSLRTRERTISLPRLVRLLRSSDFGTTEAVDWTRLKALTQIFDVALVDGGRPATFPSPSEKIAFDQQVDKMADTIKAIFVSITDTGASHLCRTETKEVMQALHYRILFGIRTEPRPKKNVFGGRDGNNYRTEVKSQGFMARFMEKQKERKALQDTNVNVPPTSSVESPPSESELLVRQQLGIKL